MSNSLTKNASSGAVLWPAPDDARFAVVRYWPTVNLAYMAVEVRNPRLTYGGSRFSFDPDPRLPDDHLQQTSLDIPDRLFPSRAAAEAAATRLNEEELVRLAYVAACGEPEDSF